MELGIKGSERIWVLSDCLCRKICWISNNKAKKKTKLRYLNNVAFSLQKYQLYFY
jgi:hypothetical protein